MQCYTHAGNITADMRVKIYFTLPELSAKKIVTRNVHVDESTKSRYVMILGRHLLTALGLNTKLSEHIIKGYDIPLKGLMTSMVDLSTYEFKT